MKTYKMKRVVVGILLVILTLGFCVVGTGAAHADRMDDPMNRQQGFGPGGQGGPMGQMGGPGGFDGQNFDGTAPDGQTPPDGGNFDRDGESFPGSGPDGENGFGPDGRPDSDGQFSRDGGFGPDHQRGFGGHGGPGRDGGPRGMDSDVREAIDALEAGETKTELETLMENVHSAMETLRSADDDKREEAESAVKEARDALNEALAAAGIDVAANEPPAKPEGDEMTPPEIPEGVEAPERPEGGSNMTVPEKVTENQT